MFRELSIVFCVMAVSFGEHDGYEHGSSYASLLTHAVPAVLTQGYGHGHDSHQIDYYAHPKYDFNYGVSDAHTNDHHSQHESRDGDVVHGEYSLHEADGTIRTVKYTADHKNGFNAQVIRTGHAIHPQIHGVHGHY
ncbi:hypothetical protein FQA39_LY06729 [Lamprigera yunnana]|nr:hypothetical protein FQA39_LY06729 [Lamprigera yunnana]